MLTGVGHRQTARWSSSNPLTLDAAVKRFHKITPTLSLSHQGVVCLIRRKLKTLLYSGERELTTLEEAFMGDRESLLNVRREIQCVGQAAYWVELVCPACEAKFQEFWLRLDSIDSTVDRLSWIEEENSYLRYRIGRYQDFGESLDDL
jgi:hypothetical protein